MKLEIISGQQGIDLTDKFMEIVNKNIQVSNKENHIWIFPESQIQHPKLLYDVVSNTVEKHIMSNSDLFILTYSDHVLNATRVEIKKHEFDGANCHQFLTNGVDVCSKIYKNGRLEIWVEDIFDVWDKALYQLI